MTLKIEGTAPHNLTFTFGANLPGNGGPFLIYKKGRKILMNETENSSMEAVKHCL